MEIKSRKINSDYTWVLGLRNSHDKCFPAGIAAAVGPDVRRRGQRANLQGARGYRDFLPRHPRPGTLRVNNPMKQHPLTIVFVLVAALLTQDSAQGDTTATINWLGGQPPLAPVGVSWGVPWPRGVDAERTALMVQHGGRQPRADAELAAGLLAGWFAQMVGPRHRRRSNWRGRLPWRSVHRRAPAIAYEVQGQRQSSLRFRLARCVCRIARSGANLIESLAVDGREVGRDGRLIAHAGRPLGIRVQANVLRQEEFISRDHKVTVEQTGPVRAVVKIEGMHAGAIRAQLAAVFRAALFHRGPDNSIRIVHSFVFDGDAQTDFIRGLGIGFHRAVPRGTAEPARPLRGGRRRRLGRAGADEPRLSRRCWSRTRSR